jgi:hypothetical protein
VYYGVYTELGTSVSKKPVDTDKAWVSRIDLDLVPPPLSVASLARSITLNEGIASTSSQIFSDKDATTPLRDDHILTETGNWAGSTADNHVVFKFDRPSTHPFMTIDGSKYQVQNCSTYRIMQMYVMSIPSLHLCSGEYAAGNYPWDQVTQCLFSFAGKVT